MDEPQEKHDHQPLNFPDNFLWGSATSGHQVEGMNINSDWWDFELRFQPPEKRSGRGADQYHRYEADFDLIKDLSQNAHRLSIEWARIEPREGEFVQAEIDHYKNVLQALKVRKIKVMLTLWHFTLPKWVADKGGWENPKTVDFFLRFIVRISPELIDDIDFWVTINEPGVYIYMSYVKGFWPPRIKSKRAALNSFLHLTEAHKKVYKFLKSLPNPKPVGIAQNVQTYHSTHKHSFKEQAAVYISDLVTNHSFYSLTKGCHDFLGVNYYFHHRINSGEGFLPKIQSSSDQSIDISDLGWEVYPEGIFDVLMDLSDHVPIYITECGIASTNDDRRTRFLIQYLKEVYRAVRAGVNVRGFFYWSLIDNFEWHQGFEPRFGLVDVDYKTLERKPRPSAYVYSEIAKNNNIAHSLLKLLGHTVKVEEVLCYMHDAPKAFCEHLQA